MSYNGYFDIDGRACLPNNPYVLGLAYGGEVIPANKTETLFAQEAPFLLFDDSRASTTRLNAYKFDATMRAYDSFGMRQEPSPFGQSWVIPVVNPNVSGAAQNPYGATNPFASAPYGTNAPGSVNGPSGVYMPNGNNPINPWNNGGYGGVGISSLPNGGVLTAPDADNPSALLNSRLSLMEKYCDKYGKIVDIDKIRSEYSSNPEEGVEYCDEIINTRFDQSKLRKIVHKEYEEFLKAKENAGKGVADQWVDAIIKQGLAPLNISAGGVSKNNVLDVIGAFAMNEEVRNGKVSLYNVMESPEVTSGLIRALKEKADDALLGDELDDREKEQVEKYISSLTFHYDKYAESLEDDNARNDVAFRDVRKKIALDYMKLFSILRISEAKHNDSVAPQYFGLPQDSSIKFEDQTQRAYKECEHKGTPKLKTIM